MRIIIVQMDIIFIVNAKIMLNLEKHAKNISFNVNYHKLFREFSKIN